MQVRKDTIRNVETNKELKKMTMLKRLSTLPRSMIAVISGIIDLPLLLLCYLGMIVYTLIWIVTGKKFKILEVSVTVKRSESYEELENKNEV